MSQRIGNLPANINIMNPVPNKDAKTIMKLIRTNGKISGYQLSDGTVLSKADYWRLQSRAASAAWRLRAATVVNICAAYRTARRATI